MRNAANPRECLTWRQTAFLSPRFRLLGVAKCGTTSLSDHIGKHPGSLPSVPDVRRYELHFLTKRGHSNGTLENHIRQAAWPWSQAVAAAPTKVYGDGTPQLHRYNHGYWVPGIGELLQHTTTTKGSGEEGEEGEGGEYDDDDYDDGDEEMESPTGSHYVHTAELVRAVDVAVRNLPLSICDC